MATAPKKPQGYQRRKNPYKCKILRNIYINRPQTEGCGHKILMLQEKWNLKIDAQFTLDLGTLSIFLVRGAN